jgi:hypothetical protein
MANNRMYLVVRPEDEPAHQILLAKGWAQGWETWEPETLAERLEKLISKCGGFSDEVFSIEYENSQQDSPVLIRSGE